MKKIVGVILCSLFIVGGCIPKYGCTAENAFNFDPKANEDNGLCEFVADAFAGQYDGYETIHRLTVNGDSLIQRTDSFIIYLVDTNRVQLREFYDCSQAQDSINCTVVFYDVFLTGSTACTNTWQNFKLTREGDSVVNYTYKKIYSPTERDSIVGRASKRN